MALRNLPNAELTRLYDSELVLKLHNPKNLRDTRTVLSHFMEYLGAYPPSPELAKGFLAKYADRKPRTLYRYTQMLRGFMKWYGQPIDDIKIKVPKTLPAYTEDSDIEKLLAAIPNKRSHKNCIERDQLLVVLGWRSGLRRAELANLLTRDIHGDSLIVRGGKGKKDRLIPLTQDVAARLHEFIKAKGRDERVFGLSPESLGMKVKQLAIKAGLSDFHTHTLRHKFATDVLESGTNVKVLQSLLGHENLNTTEVYLSITDRELYAAAKRLDEHNNRATKGNGQEKPDSGIQNVRTVLGGTASGSNGDPWTAALRVMLDPANLCQALEPEGVEELQLTCLPAINKTVANKLQGLSRNNARRRNH
ncbi:Tyrosine recombinase XerC [subsurface metagenome]